MHDTTGGLKVWAKTSVSKVQVLLLLWGAFWLSVRIYILRIVSWMFVACNFRSFPEGGVSEFRQDQYE